MTTPASERRLDEKRHAVVDDRRGISGASTRRVTIVTGGSRGIGAATVMALAEAGHDLCIGYHRDTEAACAVGELAAAQGVRVVTVRCDMAVPQDIVALFERCDEALGTPTALVNNAGIVAPRARVDELGAERIAHLFAVNVTGVFIACREVVRRLSIAHGGTGGVIVNVSSIAAKHGSPGEYVDYAASKAAVDTLTRGLAMEVASEGIRVVAVRPGIIDTDIHASGGQPDRVVRIAPSVPMGRAGDSIEVARTIRWLLSDEASYVTGALIDVAGGR